MVQRVHVVLEDDLDGTSADQTVHFAWKGTEYEIDLSDKNAEKFAAAIEPWLANARKVAGTRRRGASRGQAKSAGGPDPATVRAWARSKGIDVNDRGRVPGHVINAYLEDH